MSEPDLDNWFVRANPSLRRFELTTWPPMAPCSFEITWAMRAASRSKSGRPLPESARLLRLMTAFARLVALDGFDPGEVHREFKRIAAYADQIGRRA